jgi:hypothetical protein
MACPFLEVPGRAGPVADSGSIIPRSLVFSAADRLDRRSAHAGLKKTQMDNATFHPWQVCSSQASPQRLDCEQ